MSYQTNEAKRTAIDSILIKIAGLECNLGADSTTHDRLVTKSKQGVLLLQIKAIDCEFYKVLVP